MVETRIYNNLASQSQVLLHGGNELHKTATYIWRKIGDSPYLELAKQCSAEQILAWFLTVS
ncbi:hypothetical protein [Vibrio jasicida]|jgi:hypothetical protein|uniref:hypothetical protein n=1 Tax=Vibrio jasicida TaxID=766224 RepID=UPI00164153C0|nr:hypothetical protein [Vibrio jasicida]